MTDPVESLPAHWYHDQDVYRAEQEKIFSRNWTFLCNGDALQDRGQFFTSTVAGHPVIVVADGTGGLNGFLNLCRHRASPLCSDSSGQISQFTCPYHAWSYDLQGNLVNAPGFDGIDRDSFSLFRVRVESWNGLVFANLDAQAESLESWMGDINEIAGRFPSLPDMHFSTVRRNECHANWKNYSDNSAEGYHLRTIHPGLSVSLDGKQTIIEPHENGRYVGFDVTYRGENGGSPGYWIYKFPGLLMHFSMRSFNIERVVPLDPSRTLLERWFWFMPEVSEQQQDETISFSNQVMEEDLGICARVQANLEGGVYDTGILSPDREPGTIFFQQCVREALDG